MRAKPGLPGTAGVTAANLPAEGVEDSLPGPAKLRVMNSFRAATWAPAGPLSRDHRLAAFATATLLRLHPDMVELHL
jgi:hypothetical protein